MDSYSFVPALGLLVFNKMQTLTQEFYLIGAGHVCIHMLSMDE